MKWCIVVRLNSPGCCRWMLPVEPAKTHQKIELEKSDPLTRLAKRGGFFWVFSHRYSDGAGQNELGIVPWVEKKKKKSEQQRREKQSSAVDQAPLPTHSWTGPLPQHFLPPFPQSQGSSRQVSLSLTWSSLAFTPPNLLPRVFWGYWATCSTTNAYETQFGQSL